MMTKTKHAEFETKEGFTALFENATVGILVVSGKGDIVMANPCALRLFGYEHETLVGQPLSVLVPESSREKHIQRHRDYFKNPDQRPMGIGMELRALHKDGTEFPVEISLGHYQLGQQNLAVAFVTDITHRKAGEESFRILFENSAVAIQTWSYPEKKIININERGLSMLGFSTKEEFLENFQCQDFFVNPGDDEDIIKELEKTGAVNNKELLLKKRDGTVFWAMFFCKLTLERKIVQVVILDISKRKKTEEKLTSNDRRTKLLIKHTPAAVAMFDKQMRYINISNRWLEDYQLEGQQIIGRSHYEVFPDLPEQWKKIHQRCLAGETLSNKEDSYPRADGKIEWIRWEVCPWFESTNEIGGIIVFSEVITKQKESRERYRNLFENSLTAMFLHDLKTLRVIDVNEFGARLFGYKSREDLIANYDPHVHVIHEEERDQNIQKLIAGSDGLTREMELKKLDGTRFWVKMFVKVHHNVVQSILADITESKLAHDLLESKVNERTKEVVMALEREKELSGMKSRFVSMASHEFRTPLSAILSSLFLIESYNDSGQRDKVTKHTTRIRASVKNLTDILGDFLSVDKLEQGKVDVNYERINLSEFLKEIIDETSGILKPGQHLFQAHHGKTEIQQDRRILKNTILNLLSNAIKYTPERKKIYLTSDVTDGRATISVRDEGIGIPEDEQKNLFEKFFRARNATNIQGTGLGLNIVKRYVELIGGEIRFTSRPENGSTFTIEFPTANTHTSNFSS